MQEYLRNREHDENTGLFTNGAKAQGCKLLPPSLVSRQDAASESPADVSHCVVLAVDVSNVY
jgi:hypothetical protein